MSTGREPGQVPTERPALCTHAESAQIPPPAQGKLSD